MFRFEALRPQQDDRLAFLKGFLREPKGVGSVIPSSRFLERKMVRMAGVAQAESVIELGPGTGGTTRAILAAMPETATLAFFADMGCSLVGSFQVPMGVGTTQTFVFKKA